MMRDDWRLPPPPLTQQLMAGAQRQPIDQQPVFTSDIPGQSPRMAPSLPPVPMPGFNPPASPIPPGAQDAAMGRFPTDAGAQGPDQDMSAAYYEAQATGQDGRAAAIGAWKKGIATLTEKLAAKGFTPADPGEANLATIIKHLREQGVNPVAATGMAMEFLATMDQKPPPTGPPPQPPTRVPTGVTSI